MINLPKEKPPLKQVSEVVWEISPDYKKDAPAMLVPARIYATKKLMEQMDAGIFEQITNVAKSPISCFSANVINSIKFIFEVLGRLYNYSTRAKIL